MPARWRSQTVNLQNLLIEACWRPMVGNVAGDFHEVIDLRDGRIAVVIGDVAGFGPVAAEGAEELRGALRRATRRTTEAAALLRDLDGWVDARGQEFFATLAAAVIDPLERAVHISRAGHPPVLFHGAGETRFLDGLVDPPLGFAVQRRVVTYELRADAALFLYTDGLIERRGSALDDGLAALRDEATGLAGGGAWANELAQRTAERLGQPGDDATLVAVRLVSDRSEIAAAPHPDTRRQVGLRVYVDPGDLRSVRTEAIVRELAQRTGAHFAVEVEVIDVTGRGVETESDGVLAAPTVIRTAPHPPIRVVGGLRSVEELARVLHLTLDEEMS